MTRTAVAHLQLYLRFDLMPISIKPCPPSIHRSGVPYTFEVPPDGTLPEVESDELIVPGRTALSRWLSTHESTDRARPSELALRFRKSKHPRSHCVLATKMITRSDGRVKHLLSPTALGWRR